jgi:hypothetical protein
LFPISEVLDLLAMVKGQKPFTMKAGLKILAKLLEFGAEQIPEEPAKVEVSLEAMLDDLAGSTKEGHQPLLDNAFLKMLLGKAMEMILSKFFK